MDSEARAADDWWHSQEPARRIRLFRWLADHLHAEHLPAEGQLEMPYPSDRKVSGK